MNEDNIDSIKANRQRIIDADAAAVDRYVKAYARDHGLVIDGDWSGIPLPAPAPLKGGQGASCGALPAPPENMAPMKAKASGAKL